MKPISTWDDTRAAIMLAALQMLHLAQASDHDLTVEEAKAVEQMHTKIRAGDKDARVAASADIVARIGAIRPGFEGREVGGDLFSGPSRVCRHPPDSRRGLEADSNPWTLETTANATSRPVKRK